MVVPLGPLCQQAVQREAGQIMPCTWQPDSLSANRLLTEWASCPKYLQDTLLKMSSDNINSAIIIYSGRSGRESVEHWSHVWEIHGRVKSLAYEIDNFHFLARCLALLG